MRVLTKIILFLLITSPVFGATQQILVAGRDEDLNTTTTEYNNVFSGNLGWVSDETERQNLVPAAGTIDDLRVVIATDPTNGGSEYVFMVRLDTGCDGTGADTTLTCTIAAGSTSCNNSDGFSVSVGECVSFEIDPSATAPLTSVRSRWSMTWNPTTADESVLSGTGFSLSTSATNYMPMHASEIGTTDDDFLTLIPTPGTFDALHIALETAPNNGGGTQTRAFTLVCTGGSDITCAITEDETSCNSGALSEAVTAGQTCELTATITSGTPTASNVYYGIIFDPTQEGEWIIAQSDGDTTSNTVSRFFGLLAGDGSNEATEADANWLGQTGTFATDFTLEDIFVLLSDAPGVGNEARRFDLRVNGANSSPQLGCVVDEANTTCNASATVSVADDDTLNSEEDPTEGAGGNPDGRTEMFISYTGFIPPTVEAVTGVNTTINGVPLNGVTIN